MKVRRVNKSHLLEVDQEDSDPEELATSDQEMFNLANVNGTGKMTLEQFWNFTSVDDGNHDLAMKFDA